MGSNLIQKCLRCGTRFPYDSPHCTCPGGIPLVGLHWSDYLPVKTAETPQAPSEVDTLRARITELEEALIRTREEYHAIVATLQESEEEHDKRVLELLDAHDSEEE